jgi:hypothetical protein
MDKIVHWGPVVHHITKWINVMGTPSKNQNINRCFTAVIKLYVPCNIVCNLPVKIALSITNYFRYIFSLGHHRVHHSPLSLSLRDDNETCGFRSVGFCT